MKKQNERPQELRPQPRRQFLKTGGMAAMALVTFGCDSNDVVVKQMPLAPEMPDLDLPIDAEPGELPLPRITPNIRFYLQSIKSKDYDPQIREEDWSMPIDGLVERSIPPLTLADLKDESRFEFVEQTMTMQCIGNWIGGPLVGNAKWGGTPLKNVLNETGWSDETKKVKFTSTDGYVTSIPLDRALRDEVLLVWEMNDEQLPSRHGFPIRLINPGHYGQKMPKWITQIELIKNANHLGHWESQPQNRTVKWSDAAIATVNSRIDSPLSTWDDVKDPANGGVSFWYQTIRGNEEKKFPIHGIAMAGEQIVEKVEISVDLEGTPTGDLIWHEAHITTQVLSNQWVSWRYDWSLPSTGRYEVIARATDSSGAIQPEIDAGNDLYDGRTGWHRVAVDVERTVGELPTLPGL